MSDFSALFSQSKIIDYPDHEIILHGEDVPSGVYFIETGYVKSVSVSRLGEEKIHTIFKSGEVFPLAWILAGVHEHVHYQALGKVRVRRVSRESLLEHLRTDASLLFEYTERVVNLLSVYSNRIYTLEFSSAKERVASRLLFLAERFGVPQGSSIVLSLPITHKDIGSTVGLSRETVTRVLREFEDSEIISTEHRHIVIHALDRLRSIIA
jgi:CRP-like cAMP-binding protein